MNKKEAAATLGISTRSLENRVAKGQLTVTYQKGKSGDEAVFNEKEIMHLRDEMDRKRNIVRAAVVPDESESRELMRGHGSGLSDDALALLDVFREAMPGAIAKTGDDVPIDKKLTLKLDEAAKLSGFGRSFLRAAITSGKLKAKIIGRAWRIKPDDLKNFVNKL